MIAVILFFRSLIDLFRVYGNLILLAFQHWVRLEMHQDMVINLLCMKIDPGDSSYTPSLVVMSGGDSIHSLKELRTIHIPANETVVTLLSNLTEVTRSFVCSYQLVITFSLTFEMLLQFTLVLLSAVFLLIIVFVLIDVANVIW